ncbi:MAG TPA: hypothetical protein VER75_06715, partial [Thermoleophilaceae bacterium]|nr:hypothetical protein [Thermoleophilaceae bacterium]
MTNAVATIRKLPERGLWRDSPAQAERSKVISVLDDARAIREAVVELGCDIYELLTEYSEAVYSRAELEELLRDELAGAVFTGALRTRSKLAKQAVCRALGYPTPSRFKRVKPRFPGQD